MQNSKLNVDQTEEDAFPRYGGGGGGFVKNLDKAAERPLNRSSLFLMHI